ncbi:hypothetical protein C0J52_21769 [Blattella germanica]|nr:hypothetical protein C0J52_21769 [Blattella germanica]
MCLVDLPLPAAVNISAVSVVVCRWCGKMSDVTESQRGMIVGARLVGASAATNSDKGRGGIERHCVQCHNGNLNA